jgi:arylsulfatase A-like enzyme
MITISVLAILLAAGPEPGGVPTPATIGAARKPNVLVILIDDTGWGEIGFQGIAKDIPTPAMDSIAAGGIRFPQGYVSGPYCSPTRAGLMTGRYQTRFGHEFNSAAAANRGLSLKEKTIADLFKAAGYRTHAVGKWHLGEAESFRPTRRGFDDFLGTLANTPFFKPNKFVDTRRGDEVAPPTDPDFYTTKAYGDRAVELITKEKDQPWFLYLPFNAQHAPLEAPKDYLDRFASITDSKRKTFAAMMAAMDDQIGRILKAIRETGQDDHTLIWFVSDNGGPTQSTTSGNGPLRGFKATTWEGGVRVPFAVRWKGKLTPGVYAQPIIQLDILPTSLAAAGAEVPSGLDGVNLLPHLTGENSARPHPTLFWRFGPQWAIRDGDHKLVVGRGGSGKAELYDLAADFGESKDLAAAMPAKAEELKKKWDAWNAEQADPISPQENPAKAAKKKKNKKAGAD